MELKQLTFEEFLEINPHLRSRFPNLEEILADRARNKDEVKKKGTKK